MKEALQNVDWVQVIGVIWTVILIPILKYAKTKIDEFAKAKNIEKYTNMLINSVEIVVKDVQESVVNDIKGTKEWTPEKIEEVKEIAINKSISSMSIQGYNLLTKCNADFDEWLDSIIKAKLYDLKQYK